MLLRWFDRIVSGKVVAKHHYDYREARAVAPTRVTAVFYQGPTEMDQAVPVIESWSLTVTGVDKHGNPLTKEIYVDGLTHNTTEIGDTWPKASSQPPSAS
jgi:hypothetical protein